jgi:hypothetical protein
MTYESLFLPVMLEIDLDELTDASASMASADWLDYMAHRLIDLDAPMASKPGLRLVQPEALAA